MFRIMFAAGFALAALPAFAQQSTSAADAQPARCFIAGKAFSAGGTIRASGSVQICSPDGNWAITQQTASGCFLADNFYSAGATATVPGGKAASEVCGPDGAWTAKAAP